MAAVRGIHIYLAIILAVVTICNKASAVLATPELRLLNVVFRHGDRTPDFGGNEVYPTDPYRDSDFFPMGRGQLTNDGKNREYTLGNKLRSVYNKFLGKIYQAEAVVARSSDFDRTKMSLQLVLASLFPPAPIQTWNTQLNWQPIPATYLPRSEDNLILPDECSSYLREYDRVLKTPEVREIVGNYAELMDYLTSKTGKNITTLSDMYYLYHTLMAERSMNLPLPSWTNQLFPYGDLWDATVESYDVASYNTLLKKLFAGPLLRSMIENMKRYVNNTLEPGRKIFLYSGHETNVASMLEALDVYEPHVPEYSSAVILELRQLRNHFYVKVNYYTGIPSLMRALRIPGCDILCPFEQFLDLTAKLIPTDQDMICSKP